MRAVSFVDYINMSKDTTPNSCHIT